MPYYTAKLALGGPRRRAGPLVVAPRRRYQYCPGPPDGGWLSAVSVSHSKSVSLAFLYGRAGSLTAQNGGFRPGQ